MTECNESDSFATHMRLAGRSLERSFRRNILRKRPKDLPVVDFEPAPVPEPDPDPELRIDFSRYPLPSLDFRGDDYQMIVATDLRFLGGSSQSTIEEVLINRENGWKTGLYHISCALGGKRHEFSEGVSSLLESGSATLVNNITGDIKTRVLLFRHPSVLNVDNESLLPIETENVLLIVNHAPYKLGRIDYQLHQSVRKLRETYRATPKIYPIGPLIRRAVDEFYDGSVTMEDKDWVNVFDFDRFQTDRSPPKGDLIRVGRHSRGHREKWPTDPDEIRAAYPERPDVSISVLGGAAIPEEILGGLPESWFVYDFGTMPPEKFLSSIDVFVYFHHPEYVEAFGRVIVEAMAAGLPVVLPRSFEPLFKDAAIYCSPAEVSDHIDRLKVEEVYLEHSRRSLEFAKRLFNRGIHTRRLADFGLKSNDAT